MTWIDQGIMRRHDAVRYFRWWTLRGHAVRIEPQYHRDHVRVWLKLQRVHRGLGKKSATC